MSVSYSTFKIILPSLCIVICMLGLCGNGLVIFCSMFLNSNSKTCTGRSHHATLASFFIYAYGCLDVYVANLAIADFIFVSTIPFWAFDLMQDEWIFGNAACRVFSYITFLNMCSSILPRIEKIINFCAVFHLRGNKKPQKNRNRSLKKAPDGYGDRSVPSCRHRHKFAALSVI